MSDLFNLMAWSKADEAANAANNAVSAANQAALQSAKLREIQFDQANTDKKNALNKMFQDIFYDREPDLFKLSEIQSFVDRYEEMKKIVAFPKITIFPSFPFRYFVLSLIALALIFHGSALSFGLGLGIFAGFGPNIYNSFKEWLYYKDSKNLEFIEMLRLKEIDSTFSKIMEKAASCFSGLSPQELVSKYYIDFNIQQTFWALEKIDDKKVYSSLLQLYTLLMKNDSIDDKYTFLYMIYDYEIKRLEEQGILFTEESLEIFSKARKKYFES